MTTEEKLDRFKEICMEDARAQLKNTVEEYRSGLEAAFSEHKEDALRRREMRISFETEKTERESRKELSMDQLKLRRSISAKQDELRERLFEEVILKLNKFRATDEYRELIKTQVEDILKIAGNHSCDIYVGREDEALCSAFSGKIKAADSDFIGGTIGIIPDKNMIIDNSFRTKTENEKRKFSFDK